MLKNQEVDINNEEQEVSQALEELQEFIKSHPDSREFKRALVIQMLFQGLKSQMIPEILEVSAALISKWKTCYACEGIEGLKLKHQGSTGYLLDCDRQQIIQWLKNQKQIKLEKLENYIEDYYGVKFRSKKSYYSLLNEAGMSWKKTPKKIPREMKIWSKISPKKSVIC